MSKLINIDQLVGVAPSKRDAQWEKDLMLIFPDSTFYIDQDTPFQGPDSYSYVAVSTTGSEAVDIKDMLNWCYETGVGLVLNLKEKLAPDFVFTNGMIWNYLLRGVFMNEEANSSEMPLTHVHELSEGYLPVAVRSHIKEFLNNNGFDDVKVTLLSGGDGTKYQIIWYSEKFNSFSEKDGTTLMESISWFLPADYQMGLATKNNPDFNFQDL